MRATAITPAESVGARVARFPTAGSLPRCSGGSGFRITRFEACSALSAERTTNLYDLMDAAYDAEPIRQHSRSLGHVPLIDTNPRRDKTLAEELRTEARRLRNLGFQFAEQVRYNERTAGERVNGRLKDEFGGRHVRVRGASKVMCHCMFGVLALTADQLVRLVT